MVEMLIFQDLVKHIPAAVFCGVLFKVGYDVFDFEASAATPFLLCLSEASKEAAVQPFILYVKAAVEARIDARRTTEVLQRRYFSAVHDRDMDVVWSAAGVVEQAAYKCGDHVRAKVHRYETALAARGCNVAQLGEAEKARLQEEVRQAALAKEAARSPAARRVKELRKSLKEAGVAVADALVDESKDQPHVGAFHL